jgi:hypothetical protein
MHVTLDGEVQRREIVLLANLGNALQRHRDLSHHFLAVRLHFGRPADEVDGGEDLDGAVDELHQHQRAAVA